MLKPAVTLGLAALSFALAQAATPVAPAKPTAPATPAKPAVTAPPIKPLAPVAQLLPPIAPPGGWVLVKPNLKALPGAKVYQGTRNGYAYVMEVPARWNGSLVMYAHGFAGATADLVAQPIPIRQALIPAGYAWAASSYTANGWSVKEGTENTLDLARFFAKTVKAPKATYLVGASMGGNVVTDSIETYPTFYKAAMPVCGALTGIGLFDTFLAEREAAEAITGLHWDANVLTDPQSLAPVLQKVLPLLGTPGNYTALGKQYDSLLANLTGGPRPFRLQGLTLEFAKGATFYQAGFGLSPLGIVNLAPGANVATNAGVVYRSDPALGLDDAAFNKLVPRIAANPAVRGLGRAVGLSLPTGKIQIPVLTLHTTGDPFVPISQEQDYRRLVAANGKIDLLVQRAIRRAGHCEFSGEELWQGFTDLVAWANGGRKPLGDDLLGPLDKAGKEWTKPLQPDDPGGM
ncbi:MAG TPA: hypothetical protein VHN99_02340 [Deinococcales bacterium]|nr:hypothetical protein [Deinococcales bacterium]